MFPPGRASVCYCLLLCCSHQVGRVSQGRATPVEVRQVHVLRPRRGPRPHTQCNATPCTSPRCALLTLCTVCGAGEGAVKSGDGGGVRKHCPHCAHQGHTHGALPHRAPSSRCAADLAHHVWHRRPHPFPCRTCRSGAHSWLDKYNKNECPKCLKPLVAGGAEAGGRNEMSCIQCTAHTLHLLSGRMEMSFHSVHSVHTSHLLSVHRWPRAPHVAQVRR